MHKVRLHEVTVLCRECGEPLINEGRTSDFCDEHCAQCHHEHLSARKAVCVTCGFLVEPRFALFDEYGLIYCDQDCLNYEEGKDGDWSCDQESFQDTCYFCGISLFPDDSYSYDDYDHVICSECEQASWLDD